MARRKKVVTTVDEDEELTPAVMEGETEEIDTEEQAMESVIQSLDLGATGKVRIYLCLPNKRPAWVNTIEIQSFDFDTCIDGLSKTYPMGGEFQLHFIRSNNQIARKVPMSVAANKSKDPAQTPPQPAQSAEPQQGMAEMFAMMLQASERHAQQMMTVVTTALQAKQVSAPAAVGLQLADIAKLAAPLAPLLRDMFIRRTDPVADFRNMLGALKTVQTMNPPAESGEGGGLMDKVLNLLGPALMQAAPPMALQQPAPGPGNSPSAVGAGSTQPHPEPESTPAPAVDPNDPDMFKFMLVRAVRSQLPKFIKAAERGTSAESYADVIADEYEDSNPGAIDTLLEILEKPDWCNVLFGREDVPHRPWFDELRASLLDAYKQEPETKEAR